MMKKILTPFILINIFHIEKKKKNEKVVLIKTPIMKSPLSHFTAQNTPFVYREEHFRIFLTQKN